MYTSSMVLICKYIKPLCDPPMASAAMQIDHGLAIGTGLSPCSYHLGGFTTDPSPPAKG